MSLLTVLKFAFGLYQEVRRAIRLYRRAKAEGRINEHTKIMEELEQAQTDEDRRRLLTASGNVMRQGSPE
jgi:hypothetical protein